MKEEKQEDNKKSEEIPEVELRFCTACQIEQPLRSKHCRACDHCISTYDVTCLIEE